MQLALSSWLEYIFVALQSLLSRNILNSSVWFGIFNFCSTLFFFYPILCSQASLFFLRMLIRLISLPVSTSNFYLVFLFISSSRRLSSLFLLVFFQFCSSRRLFHFVTLPNYDERHLHFRFHQSCPVRLFFLELCSLMELWHRCEGQCQPLQFLPQVSQTYKKPTAFLASTGCSTLVQWQPYRKFGRPAGLVVVMSRASCKCTNNDSSLTGAQLAALFMLIVLYRQ